MGTRNEGYEGVIPQHGNSNPMDTGEIHSDPVGSKMTDHQTTLTVSIAPDRIDFSIASQPETMTTELSFTRFKKQALALFA